MVRKVLYFFWVIFGGQTDNLAGQPTDRLTAELGIKAPSQSLTTVVNFMFDSSVPVRCRLYLVTKNLLNIGTLKTFPKNLLDFVQRT